MFLLRLNKRVNAAFALRISLTAKATFYIRVGEEKAEFYNKIARGISISKALYANEYSEW